MITCPVDFTGTIVNIPTIALTGNASVSVSGGSCGSVNLTYVDNLPALPFNKRNEEPVITIEPIDPPISSTPGEGYYAGQEMNYTELPMPEGMMKKRSVTWPDDFMEKVGNFPSPIAIQGDQPDNNPWITSLETDGVIRYAVFTANQSLAILQTDYYDITKNAHFFNPASENIFPPGSNCYANGSSLGWPNQLKRDRATNRFVFVYFNPANASILCLVISNTNDFFNGGGYGYQINFPVTFNTISRLDFGIFNGNYTVCFDDYTQPEFTISPAITAVPLKWANCYVIFGSNITNGASSTKICNNRIGDIEFTNTSATVLHTTNAYSFSFSGWRAQKFSCLLWINNTCLSPRMLAITRVVSDFNTCTLSTFSTFDIHMPTTSIITDAIQPTNPYLPTSNGVNIANPGLQKLSFDFNGVRSVYAFTVYNGTRNSYIVYGVGALENIFDPFPGTYLTGLNVFAPNVKFFFDGSIVMSYLSTSYNGTYPVTSISYAYALSSDPSFTLRPAGSGLTLNGLPNPQQLTVNNMSNPIVAGLAVPPGNRYEFTIFGPGGSSGLEFVNQNFRIQGESFQRTFTVADDCGNASCVQNIYLNSTRELILTCPATYYGTIYEGNGTYLSPSVTGNATSYVGNPCGGVTLTWTAENPPTNNVQEFKRQDPFSETIVDPDAVPVNLGPPIEGHLMGGIDSFTDLPLPQMTENQTAAAKKRSVTSPRDWTQQVGDFGTTYNITSAYAPGFNWLSALETDGVLRYAVYNTNQSFAILQHDYYNITGNAHFFNPGEVFPNGSPCDIPPGTSTSGWQHDLKRDIKLNRYVFVYFNVSVTNIMCLVISNTSDFFNGGAVGYEVMLTSNSSYFGSNHRLRFSINGDVYSFCFDDFTQDIATNVNMDISSLYWGNCFALERARIIIAANNPRLCPLQINLLNNRFRTNANYSFETIHQTSLVETALGIATSSGYVSIPVFEPSGTYIVRFDYNGNTTDWNFNSGCIVSAANTGVNSLADVPKVFTSSLVPIYSNGLFAKADPTKFSFDMQDRVFQAVAWVIPGTVSSNSKIGWAIIGFDDSLSLVGLFNAVFDPYPGNYTHGVHVFAPTIKILPNKRGIVIAYQQSTLNPSLSLPSTSYGYWIRGDPSGVLRKAEYPLNLNNLANPQRLTATNLTNPISTGLAVHPTKIEFSIFGPGDAASPTRWSFINQDFRAAGERWTRTFTLSDACGNTSCVQEIYLNSTI
jgi:hypothetical protein